ncbi:hypothetical protein Tco_1290172, partial [Tanacetum coccineum]
FDESDIRVLEIFDTSAGNPVKEILLKLNLPDHRILKDGGEVKEFQRSFCHSDIERLSRSDEVLKLKNFKKDATLKLFKSTNQERYEHVGPEVTSLQGGKVHKMAKRDYAWLMISRCSRSHSRQAKEQAQDLKSMITASNHKLMIEVKDYELKTKVEAYCLEVIAAKVRVTAAKHNLVLLLILVKNMLSKNDNAPIVTKLIDGKETAIPPTSVKEKAQRRAKLKARSTLFGGNTATKKTQTNLLKQQYENFAASSTEVIEQTYEKLQKLISQLEMHGERNKSEIKTLSLDDIFNNLKACKSEVKGTSNSTTNSHNVAFLSSGSTNNASRAVNTAQDVNISSTQGTADSSKFK